MDTRPDYGGITKETGFFECCVENHKAYEKAQATLKVMNELAKGRKSGEEKGWLALETVEEYLEIENE